jgi:hypothetical protein
VPGYEGIPAGRRIRRQGFAGQAVVPTSRPDGKTPSGGRSGRYRRPVRLDKSGPAGSIRFPERMPTARFVLGHEFSSVVIPSSKIRTLGLFLPRLSRQAPGLDQE